MSSSAESKPLPPPPPDKDVREILANAPNFPTLQQICQALRLNFPHASLLSRESWWKAADDRVIEWIRAAPDAAEASYFVNSTLTIAAWPGNHKGRVRIYEASRQRIAELSRHDKPTRPQSHTQPPA